jgi:small subunit ribosomal protein S20
MAARRRQNLYYLTTMRSRVKTVETAVAGNDGAAAKAALTEAMQRLEKAAQAGVIKRKNASRKISRLVRAVARLEKPAK